LISSFRFVAGCRRVAAIGGCNKNRKAAAGRRRVRSGEDEPEVIELRDGDEEEQVSSDEDDEDDDDDEVICSGTYSPTPTAKAAPVLEPRG
jgi:hypothetical protein